MMNQILKSDMEDIYSRNIDWNLLNGKTVMLTGAYGMLASYIVYFLMYLKRVKYVDVKLIAVVRNASKFNNKFSEFDFKDIVVVVENDLTDEIQVEDVDYIIHAASFASPQYYSVCPVDVLLPNTIGTYNLLKLAVQKHVEGFLLFSSCDIYGTINQTGVYDEAMMGSMDTLDIHNCYSESKRMAETMCESFYVQYNVPVKIARIAHTYAPTMDIENDPRVFSSFVHNIVNNQDIVMKSDGTGKRTFCYITDAVAGYFKILFDGKPGEAYNVCNTEQYVSVRELAECLVSLYPEKKLKVVRKERDKSEHYTENVLQIGRETIPDNSKLKLLGWNAEVDIREGFDRVIRYIELI